MNLVTRWKEQGESETFLPEFRRYKYYPVDREEEEAIKQAEICLDVLSDKLREAGDEDKARTMSHSFKVMRRMRLGLTTMGATRTTMGYN